MLPYFEKALCSVVQGIKYTLIFILFIKLFNVNIYSLFDTIVIVINVIAFSISTLQTSIRTTVVVHKSSSPLRSSTIMKGKITNSLKPPLIQTWCTFNMFLVLCVGSLSRSELGLLFLLILLSKFIDMYRMDTVLFLILLISEMLKIPRAKVEAHFLKKPAIVTNKYLAQDSFGKCPRTTENLSIYKTVRE